mmetsp:Transcript_9527/g.20084  ORF Transcript_9527/g.20084 Transcript_9527/m.20084 type:complete len:379 (+) Transcript_9527:246-1382(+)
MKAFVVPGSSRSLTIDSSRRNRYENQKTCCDSLHRNSHVVPQHLKRSARRGDAIRAVGIIPQDQVVVDLNKPYAQGNFGSVYFGHASTTQTPLVVKVASDHPYADELLETERLVYTKLCRNWASESAQRYWPQFLGYVRPKDSNKTVLVFRREEDSSTLHSYLEQPHTLSELYSCTRARAERGGSVLRLELFRAVVPQLLSALKNLHAKHGIIHRDLKPANVLVCGQDEEFPIKVIDFGSSCERRGLLSRRGANVTTFDPAYVAPEETIDAWNRANERFDLFSLGIIGVRLLFPSMGSEFALEPFRESLKSCRYNFYGWISESKSQNGRRGFATLSETYAIENDPLGAECAALLHDMLREYPQQRPSAAKAAVSAAFA